MAIDVVDPVFRLCVSRMLTESLGRWFELGMYSGKLAFPKDYDEDIVAWLRDSWIEGDASCNLT